MTDRRHAHTPHVAQRSQNARVKRTTAGIAEERTFYCTQVSSFRFCVCDHVRAAAVPRPRAWSAAPRSPCVACSIQGLLGLLLRSFGAVGSAIEDTSTQDFERPRLSHPHQVSTLCSALVYCASQNVIRGPIFSPCLRQQRLWSMPPHGLGMT